MATLVLEDGTGLEDANAYADITLAETFFPAFLTDLTVWDPATDQAKDDALIAGTLYMDLVYTWLGEQANPDGKGNPTGQALDFPRISIRSCSKGGPEPSGLLIGSPSTASVRQLLCQ